MICRCRKGISKDDETGVVTKPKPASLRTLVRNESKSARFMTHRSFFTPLSYPQFRYASVRDVILLFIGTVCAILNGTGFPIVMLIFGQLTDAFIDQSISAAFVQPSNINSTVQCLEMVYPTLINVSNVSDALSVNITTGFVDCDAQFNLENVTTTLDNIIVMCYGEGRACLETTGFTDIIVMQCYIFVGIAVAILILSALQSLLYQLVAERQVHLIRQKFYQSILRQNIGWFDANPSGELSSRLSE